VNIQWRTIVLNLGLNFSGMIAVAIENKKIYDKNVSNSLIFFVEFQVFSL